MNPAFVNKNDLSFSSYQTYAKYGKHPEPKYMDAFAGGNVVSSVQTSRTDVESDLRGVTRKITACESVKNSFIKTSEGSSSITIPEQPGRASKKIKLDKKDLKIGENHVRCTCETCMNINIPKPKVSNFKPRGFN